MDTSFEQVHVDLGLTARKVFIHKLDDDVSRRGHDFPSIQVLRSFSRAVYLPVAYTRKPLAGGGRPASGVPPPRRSAWEKAGRRSSLLRSSCTSAIRLQTVPGEKLLARSLRRARLPDHAFSSIWRPRVSKIRRADDLAAVARAQSTPNTEGDGALDEPHRSIAQEEIDSTRMLARRRYLDRNVDHGCRPPHHHPAHTGTGRAVGAGDVVVVGGRHVADAPGRTHPAVDHRGHTAGRVQRGALLKRVIDRHRASYLKHITTCLPLCRRGDTPALLHSCARQARTASGCWCTALAGLPHALIAPRARAGRRERR